MSSDGVARVFNLDPRLHGSRCNKHRIMAPREGSFLDSIRASFSTKTIRIDNSSGSHTNATKNDKRRREKGRERDLSFIILPRSASSLIPGKTSNTTFSLPPPLPRSEDRLPRHSNIFTGVPTPTNSAVTSTRNSQHVPSKPGTPVHEHPLRSSRSVPDWTAEQRKQYCYFQDGSEDQLPRIPSTYKPQPISQPGITVDGVERLGKAAKTRGVSGDSSLKLTSIGRYKRKQGAGEPSGGGSFCQQRSPMKPQKSQHLEEKYGKQEEEAPGAFLGVNSLGSGASGRRPAHLPAREQRQQQPDQSFMPQSSLPQTQQQIRRRSTAPAGVIENDQKHTSSTSQRRTDRPTSTSIYQAHRTQPLCPVAEEALPSISLPRWGRNWSPHLQQGSELFFETGVGVTLPRSPKPAPESLPLAEMGIPSPQTKARPASWACPTRPTAAVNSGLVMSSITRHSHELDIMFPPTPPSSTGDAWDDHNDSGVATRERKILWNSLRHFWNVFILVWALLLVFKSVQFVMKFVDVVLLEPVKLFCSILRGVAEG